MSRSPGPTRRFSACRLLPSFAFAGLMAIACAPGGETGGPATDVGNSADLVLVGGRLVTVDEQLPEAEALAAKDGVIVALGSRADVEPWIGEGTEVIDLAGNLAIPGLIEGHGHFLGLGDARLQLDLRQAASWDDIVAQVAAAVADTAPGEWIRGRGWHQDKWQTPVTPAVEGFPIHDALSAVSPDHPVALTHASGHAVFVNAKAMQLAGIDETTADPEGGEILRAPDGRATGLLRETAEGLVTAAQAAGGDTVVRQQIRLASAECLAKGITSFQDAGTSFADIDRLAAAASEGLLGVRLWVMVLGSEPELGDRLAAYKRREPMGFLSVGGVKLWLDGALGSRGAWLLEPYSDSPHSTGLNVVSLDKAREVAEASITNGYQLGIHAIGDRANRELLDLYEGVFAAHPDRRDLRWRIEHAQHLHPTDIPRFAELGVIASMQGVHCTSDGPWVPDRLGEERAREGAYVWRQLLDSGAKIVNGTDVPVEDVSPIANFYASVTRRMHNGEAFYPGESMTRMEALRSLTLDAAYGAFEEEAKGSLAVGKLADVTVLSQDILEIPEEDIPATEVVYTIVGGKVAYRAGA